MKSNQKTLPGLEGLFPEIISEKPRKRKRGRPRKYDNPTHRKYLKNRANQGLGAMMLKKLANGGKLTVRQQQNLIRAEHAQEILKGSEGGDFLTRYFLNRNTLLGEIGRIERKDWLIRAAEHIADNELKGEAARVVIRKFRLGNHYPDSAVLARKISKAMREYRKLYPYQTDESFKQEFESIMKDEVDCLAWKISHGKKASPPA